MRSSVFDCSARALNSEANEQLHVEQSERIMNVLAASAQLRMQRVWAGASWSISTGGEDANPES
jgi:hypothetical protein